jgi:DNA-binding transcriptional regulator YdaS (Cro superfamily)
MKLSEWVDLERGRQSSLARAIGADSQLVWQWARGMRQVPADRCPAIERATGGEVRCEELRPDVEWSVLRTPLPADAEQQARVANG